MSVASVRFRVAYVQTSEAVSVEPDVSVRVPLVQTSATNVPKVERLLVVADQTADGIVERSDVEAVRTVELVLALMVLTALATVAVIFAFTLVPTEVDAVVIAEANEEEALLIAEPIEEEALLVLALTEAMTAAL